MIKINLSRDCTGCGACVAVCPRHCIAFQADSEGFRYPAVDAARCVNCDLCVRVCPVATPDEAAAAPSEAPPRVFAAYANDESIRRDSTSGGIFSVLAQAVFARGGWVGGAVFDSDFSVRHRITDDAGELEHLRSSKYLQSRFEDIFPEARRLLEAGRELLIAGTPCQIAALHRYLGRRYEKLTTVDFICLGVPSPKVFQKYLAMQERLHHSRAVKVKFKNKTFGWHRFALKIDFASGASYCRDRYHDLFFVGYLMYKNFSRPSCYFCRFKGAPQAADLTLGDFWGIEKLDPSMDQDCGTSLVIVNTPRGAASFDGVRNHLTTKEFSLADIAPGNRALHQSPQAKGGNRKKFFADLDRYPFEKVAARYYAAGRPARLWRGCGKLGKFWKHAGFSPGSWLKLLAMNLLTRGIRSDEAFRLQPLRRSCFYIGRRARLTLTGDLLTGVQQCPGASLETRILLEPGAKMNVSGNFAVYAGSFIRVLKSGELQLGGGFINENTQITCAGRISIGSDCVIARDVIIRDYDGHEILRDDSRMTAPITIGNHVWIGQRAMILKGVTIGDGAIIAAGAIVTGDVPAHSVAAGVPAKVIRTNTDWK